MIHSQFTDLIDVHDITGFIVHLCANRIDSLRVAKNAENAFLDLKARIRNVCAWGRRITPENNFGVSICTQLASIPN